MRQAQGVGPAGKEPLGYEVVVSGLEVPWGIAFLPNGDWLVTERPGRIRLVQKGALRPEPVATLEVAAEGEGGLLGIALHPSFAQNRQFFVYATVQAGGGKTENQVQRWVLAEDHRSAQLHSVVVGNIPAAAFHNGGRLRVGWDRRLYVSTGDARKPELSQDPDSLSGKLLRFTPSGEVPSDNPFPNSPVFLSGLRNSQGFDGRPDGSWVVTDHGPSGELGLRGHDEVSLARPGDNLGWPKVVGCEEKKGMVSPVLSFVQAMPPGGAALYRGSKMPQLAGNLFIGSLGATHLHRVVFEGSRVSRHETYFAGHPPQGLGRLREVVMAPDGELYFTTSNCDGRGRCPPEKDRILRLVLLKSR